MTTEKSKVTLLVLLLVLAAFVAAGCNLFPQRAAPQQETLTIGVTPWTTTIPPSVIVANILEEHLDYQVELQEADVGPVYTGLATGDIDIFLDAWLPNLHEGYMEELGDQIDEVGVSYFSEELGWAVPDYVPVNSIVELNDYRDEFNGQFFGIDPGAGMTRTSREIIATYDLDFELVEGSEWAMLTEVTRALDNEEWIVFQAWRPHWMFVIWDIKFLEDPEGIWQPDEVRTLVTKGLEKRAPEAVAFLRNWEISLEDMEKLIYQMEVENEDVEVLAQEWLEENQDRVAEMLP